MDTKHFELLLRPTTFGTFLPTEVWDDLNTLERIDLITFLDCIPNELVDKALKDSNPVIRMLALSICGISEEHDVDWDQVLEADKFPFISAALHARRFFPTPPALDDFIKLNHIQRLGAIALSDCISENHFAKFICEGLQKKLFSEEEAAELLFEFVKNPWLHRELRSGPLNADDWHTKSKDFEAIWNLTTCTPPEVHYAIAAENPFERGLHDSIPRKILDRMSQDALEALAYRGYEPLLKLIKQNPKRYAEKVQEAAQTYFELQRSNEIMEPTDSGGLSAKLNKFRSEVNERFDKIENQLAELLSRR